MNNELVIYALIYVLAVFISAVSQVMLKISAKKTYSSAIREYLNPWVIISYGLFFGCTLITMLAYTKIPLSLGQILESTGYIFVTVLGAFILKEKVTKKKLIGMAVILFGVFAFTL